MSFSRARYIMDDPREASRLRAKANAGEWVAKHILRHVTPGCRFLEVGCGPGEFVHAVLSAEPGIRAAGVDSSPERIAEARSRNGHFTSAEFFCCDAHALLPEPNSFDLVFSRFMLEYVRDKQQAVNEMFRVCRPGGKVILQDLDGQLLWHYPEEPAMQSAVETVVASLARTGFDPYTGRKLFSLARRAGFTDVQVSAEPYHLYAGAIDPENKRHWEAKLEIAKPLMRDALGGDDAAGELCRRFLDYLSDPETLTYSILFTVLGIKPEE